MENSSMTETVKIKAKIVSVKLAADNPQAAAEPEQLRMHENIKREPKLTGTTYQIKPPNLAAMYITINDVILDGIRHPYEIFINSKDMDHFQWIVALTRVISAVFRKGGDIVFLVEELKSVFDPKGGYFKKGKFMNSLVAEIGNVVEEHLIGLGLIQSEELSDSTKELIAKKKEEIGMTPDSIKYPESAQICKTCSTKAAVLMDGCLTCLACGSSKCG